MIRNHLLGLPFIFGMERAPTPAAVMSDPAKTPSQIAAELEEQRRKAQAEDAKAYAKMTPPAGAKPREPAYQPEGFDFHYHGPKGQSGEVIKGRPEPAAVERTPAEPVASTGSATHRHIGPGTPFLYRVCNGAVECATADAPNYWRPSLIYRPADLGLADIFEVLAPTAPTEWQSGPPPSVGWYAAIDSADRKECWARHWNGCRWSSAVAKTTAVVSTSCASPRTQRQRT